MVRVSGPLSAEILGRIFLPAKKWKSRRLYHGFIYNNGEKQDEVMAVLMRGPRSYTGEDTAEIYTHGGMAVNVLRTVIENGARPAMPGEFTQRAFLNGRIDLTQAEAVMDLINAKTDAARRAGLRQLGGGLSGKINGFRERLLKFLAHIELSIDYPEHESEAMNLEMIGRECVVLLNEMRSLTETSRTGKIISEGLRAVIIGRPNVGKSSLMNVMLGEDRAIVTEIPGTTRDILNEPVQIHGFPLLLADTAGIRETDELIERKGVEKAYEQAAAAELVLFLADRSKPPSGEDEEIKNLNKTTVMLLNKSDLPAADGWEAYPEAIHISAKERLGLEELYAKICALFFESPNINGREADIITRERHRCLLEQSVFHIETAMEAIKDGIPEDLVSVDLKAAYYALNELVGAEISDDLTDKIFSEFCVGK
jgi:tRNA modification GTPase